MSIKVNTSILESKATYANTLASQLKEKVSQINSIYYRLDSEIKSRQGIDSSMRILQLRLEKAEQKMYNISKFLSGAAMQYNNAESAIVEKGKSLVILQFKVINGTGALSVGAVNGKAASSLATKKANDTGATQGKAEGKKWYQSNLFKIAVGAVVVGAAVALAVTIGGPILIGMAVGAVIGAAAGGIIGGVSSKLSGGSFGDGFSDGFMWGAIGGAASGALEGAGLGLIGLGTANGLVSSSIYAGQTLENGGHLNAVGFASSFVIGGGLSVLSTVLSSKISGAVSKNVDVEIGEIAEKSVNKVVNGANLDQSVIDDILSTPKGQRPDPSTYLSDQYIEQHLKQFENGASYLMPKSDYDLYYRGKLEISRPDGTLFVTSKDYMDEVITKANGDLSYIEDALGYPPDSLSSGDFTRIDTNNPNNYNVHMPTGNENGANSEWIPGGYTSGGVPESIIDNVPNNKSAIDTSNIRLERN